MGRWSAWKDLLGVLWHRTYAAGEREASAARALLTNWPKPEREDKVLLGSVTIGGVLIVASWTLYAIYGR